MMVYSSRYLHVSEWISWDSLACRIHPWERSSLSCFQEKLALSLPSVSHWSEGLPSTRFSLSGQILFWNSLSFWFTFLGKILSTREVWRAWKRRKVRQEQLQPLECSPNFPSAQYLDKFHSWNMNWLFYNIIKVTNAAVNVIWSL